ncbi:MAG: tRNA(5-methylaminomethyl-2-thiouridylate) methyltransferase [Desulfovibrio sp.]|jgi:hypothetical protein|nr:tRNA(5-methylaminomethyl-2-thiouridylate) methyltransferase [Desulfovibrio sp.]
MSREQRYDVIALLSGGLDSILASRLIQAQGRKVLCLHFVTPFFGKPHLTDKWQEIYGLTVRPVDISREFVALLVRRPAHGFGKVLNPCVDCKILLLRAAREMMGQFGAKVIITGEVLGQRPMSQRRDVLNVIRREAGVRDLLLRPLCARHLEPTPAETSGFIDRSGLLGFSGRGRKNQLELAGKFGITDIPTPAGGCRLTEQGSARAFWPVLRFLPRPEPADFVLAKTGRQYWNLEGRSPRWLCVGRNLADNERLEAQAGPEDLLLEAVGHTGATALGRTLPGDSWDNDSVRSAAAFAASFSGKAVRHHAATGEDIAVRVFSRSRGSGVLSVRPRREGLGWGEYSWEAARAEMRAEAKAREGR